MWVQSKKRKSELRIKSLEYFYRCMQCDALDYIKRHVHGNHYSYSTEQTIKRMKELLDMIDLENSIYQ